MRRAEGPAALSPAEQALAGAALLAAALPGAAQLAIAAAAMLALGLPHGASDLAVVPPARRAPFLLAYGLVIGAVLAAWSLAPTAALSTFLLLSAVHFAWDGAPPERPLERAAHGMLLVAGPALLHRVAVARLFAMLTSHAAAAAWLVDAMGAAALVGVAAAGWCVVRDRRDRPAEALRLAVGGVLLIVLPPLLGFASGFVLLHAGPQLAERMRATGCRTLWRYLRLTAPVLAGSGVVIAAAAWLFADRPAPALSGLFALLAALALPHMLVTPLFARPIRPRAAGGTHAGRVVSAAPFA